MTENEKLPHSKAGIASFAIGCIALLLAWLVLWGNIGENFITSFVLLVVGALLGAMGKLQHERNRTFAKLGFWLNIIPLVMACGWFALALLGFFGS